MKLIISGIRYGKVTTAKMLKQAMDWLNEKHHAGAKKLGVTCNPIQRKLFLTADEERLILDGPSQQHTRILKDILHDYIAQLPTKAKP